MDPLRAALAHDKTDGVAPMVRAALEICFRKLHLEFIVNQRAEDVTTFLPRRRIKLVPPAPEKESSQNRAGGLSEGSTPPKASC
jgi:hypothetical protein